MRRKLRLLAIMLIALLLGFDTGFFSGYKVASNKKIEDPSLVYLMPEKKLVIQPICNPNQLVSVREIIAADKGPALELECVNGQPAPQPQLKNGWGIPK